MHVVSRCTEKLLVLNWMFKSYVDQREINKAMDVTKTSPIVIHFYSLMVLFTPPSRILEQHHLRNVTFYKKTKKEKSYFSKISGELKHPESRIQFVR